MSLEPWEIELQKNIEKISDVSAPQVAQPSAVSEIPVVTGEQPKNNQNSQQNTNGSWMFLVLFVILSSAIVYVYNDKSNGKLKQWISSTFKYSADNKKTDKYNDEDFVAPKLQPKIEENSAPKKEEPKNESVSPKVEQNTKLEELAKKLDITSNRVILMGMLLNENFNMLEQNVQDNFMYFNADWTLDRMPRYLQLSESDIEYLRKYTKNQ